MEDKTRFVHPIIIISAPSFNTSSGLQLAMDKIFETVRDNSNRQFIFGIVERLDWHVFNYAKEYKVPLANLRNIRFKPDTDKRFISRAIGDLIHTEPYKVIVFRDNNVSDIAGELVDRCIAAGLTVVDIDSYGNTKFLNSETKRERANYYYRENPHDHHWADVGGGEYRR